MDNRLNVFYRSGFYDDTNGISRSSWNRIISRKKIKGCALEKIWWYIERSREYRTVKVAAVGKNRRPPLQPTTTGLNGRGGIPEPPEPPLVSLRQRCSRSPLILEIKPRSPNAPPFVRYIVVLFYFFYFVLSAPRTSPLGAPCPAANYLPLYCPAQIPAPDQIGARLLRQLIICPLDHRSQLAANYLPRPTANFQSGSSRLVRLPFKQANVQLPETMVRLRPRCSSSALLVSIDFIVFPRKNCF